MRLWLGILLLSSCSLAVDQDSQSYDLQLDAAPDAPMSTGLVLNEVAPSGRPDDWFEIYNGTGQAIDLEVYSYSDQADREAVRFFGQVIVEPGAYHVEFLTDDYPGFGLGGEEEVRLYERGVLIDRLQWTMADGIEDGTLARLPDVVGRPTTTQAPTPGFPNQL